MKAPDRWPLALVALSSLLASAMPSASPALAQDSTCPDPHASIDTACSLSESAALQDVIPGAGARNVYRFEALAAGTRVQVDLTDLPADYDLYLVDGGGNIVDQSVHEGTTPESLDRTLDSKGVFFVYVVADPGRAADTSGPYTLSFRLAGPRSEWTLLRSDDFTDPVHGLFLDRQRGTGQEPLPGGGIHRYQWEYSYTDGALVSLVKGPFQGDRSLTASAEALGKVDADFAVEVRARVTKSSDQAEWTIGFSPRPRENYAVILFPERRTFSVWDNQQHKTLGSGSDRAINPRGEENLLRLEVQGETMTLFANGQRLYRIDRPWARAEGGSLFLGVNMRGPPSEGDVEVRFEDFKVYAWRSP